MGTFSNAHKDTIIDLATVDYKKIMDLRTWEPYFRVRWINICSVDFSEGAGFPL